MRGREINNSVKLFDPLIMLITMFRERPGDNNQWNESVINNEKDCNR